MLLTGKGLVEFSKTKLGTPYVYGMKGSILTKDKFAILQKTYGIKYVWKTDANKIGKVCCDCSGLISWYTNKLYGSSDLYNRASERHLISSIGDAPIGALVWKRGHVGVYIGYENGVPMYIAEDGSAYGCRKNKLSNAKFTHWLLMPYITYDISTSKNYVVPKDTYPHYRAHIQSIGWGAVQNVGGLAGTTGRALRMEAIKIDYPSVVIEAKAHIQSIGDVSYGVINSNTVIGTTGQKKRLEALYLKGAIQARVHVQSIGWMPWTNMSTGTWIGTKGKALRMEAIEIKRL